MFLADRHIEELKRELWKAFPAVRARYAELFARDPQGFARAARRAADDNNNRALIAMAEVLVERDALTSKPFHKIRFVPALLPRLIDEGRPREALDLLERADIANPGHPKYWLLKARAFAALGRLKEAHRAVRESLALDPAASEAEALRRTVVAAIKLSRQMEAGEGGWAQLARLAEACLALGLNGRARSFLKRGLSAWPDVGPADHDDAVRVLELAADLLGPSQSYKRSRALLKARPDDGRLQALMMGWLIDLDRASEAVGDDSGGRSLRLQRALAAAATGDLDTAIGRLGRLSVDFREDLEVRAALAYWVGAQVLREAPLDLAPAGDRPRVFNLMPFNDELDLLELHLAEMHDWVDLFVIAESTETFTGLPKPLHFERNKARFAPWADKIRHVVVEGHPEAFHSPWGRDFRQRDMAIGALSGLCAPDDLVLLTDVDEIVDRRALEGFDGDFAGLRMATYRFFLNYRPTADNLPWRRTGAVFKAGLLQRFGSSYARFTLARAKHGYLLDESGWHFTSVGDSTRVVAKVNSYAHQERKSVWRDEDRVARLLARIRAGHYEPRWERAEIDDSFPRAIRDRADNLRDLMI